LKTDLDPDAARHASAKLEESFAALSDLGFASADKPKLRIDVVYFRHEEDFREIGPKMAIGVALRTGRHDFERTPTVILSGDFVEKTKRVLQHELSHLLIGYYYPQAGTWLNEGFAQYFETLVTEDGTATLGRPHKEVRFVKGPWRFVKEPQGWV